MLIIKRGYTLVSSDITDSIVGCDYFTAGLNLYHTRLHTFAQTQQKLGKRNPALLQRGYEFCPATLAIKATPIFVFKDRLFKAPGYYAIGCWGSAKLENARIYTGVSTSNKLPLFWWLSHDDNMPAAHTLRVGEGGYVFSQEEQARFDVSLDSELYVFRIKIIADHETFSKEKTHVDC